MGNGMRRASYQARAMQDIIDAYKRRYLYTTHSDIRIRKGVAEAAAGRSERVVEMAPQPPVIRLAVTGVEVAHHDHVPLASCCLGLECGDGRLLPPRVELIRVWEPEEAG